MDQIGNVYSKSSWKFGWLSLKLQCTPLEIHLKLFKSCIQPTTYYPPSIWGDTTVSNFNRTQELFKLCSQNNYKGDCLHWCQCYCPSENPGLNVGFATILLFHLIVIWYSSPVESHNHHFIIIISSSIVLVFPNNSGHHWNRASFTLNDRAWINMLSIKGPEMSWYTLSCQ